MKVFLVTCILVIVKSPQGPQSYFVAWQLALGNYFNNTQSQNVLLSFVHSRLKPLGCCLSLSKVHLSRASFLLSFANFQKTGHGSVMPRAKNSFDSETCHQSLLCDLTDSANFKGNTECGIDWCYAMLGATLTSNRQTENFNPQQ